MPEMSDTIARLLRIHGRVQGVYYRASTVQQAERLGVHGWVRNRADGSVEALVQGTPDAVQALIDWAHQGPARAQVERVEVSEAPAEAVPGFTQAGTV
ncbi:acylphosphatase [Ottowia sp. GY511]|nr:acylphosphatase [Ottowia sp. GY511]TXK28572.1 acylphosphatase [Ottowia sp. GY511]